MITGDSRKMIIIKNISSDIVEEAILILKKEGTEIYSDNRNDDYNNHCVDEFVLKEAEMIVNNYEKECRRKARIKYSKQSRRGIIVSYLINFLLIGSIIILAFSILKVF